MNKSHQNNQDYKELAQVTSGQPCSDGSGVQLTRLIGNNVLTMLDPSLLLDVIQSEKPQEYMGGYDSIKRLVLENLS